MLDRVAVRPPLSKKGEAEVRKARVNILYKDPLIDCFYRPTPIGSRGHAVVLSNWTPTTTQHNSQGQRWLAGAQPNDIDLVFQSVAVAGCTDPSSSLQVENERIRILAAAFEMNLLDTVRWGVYFLQGCPTT